MSGVVLEPGPFKSLTLIHLQRCGESTFLLFNLWYCHTIVNSSSTIWTTDLALILGVWTLFKEGICVLEFSLICRLLLSAMTRTQWPALAKEVFRICKPGTGWAQLIEASAYLSCDDGSVPDDAPLWEVFNTICRVNWSVVSALGTWILRIGGRIYLGKSWPCLRSA